MIKKIISIICLVFIILALYLINNSSATEYELSIYSSTPILVWIFLIGSIGGGTYIIIQQAFSDDNGIWWMIGFLILMIDNFIILSLSGLRGYFQYAGTDHMAHLQYIKVLVDTGKMDVNNLYPIIHILSTQISEITNFSPDIIVRYLPAYLSVLFLMLFNHLLAKISLFEKGQVLLATATSFVPVFNSLHIQIYPHTFSVLLYTLIFYLYFQILKKPCWQFKILFAVLLILLPYTHPSGSLVMILILIPIELARLYYEKIYDPKKLRKIISYPIIISFIVFFVWQSSFAEFDNNISLIRFDTVHNSNIAEVQKISQQLNLKEKIEYAFKMYGHKLIYIMLGLIAGILILKRLKYIEIKYLFILFMFFIMSMPISYVIFIGMGNETMGRFLNLPYLIIVTPLLVGFVLYESFKKKDFQPRRYL